MRVHLVGVRLSMMREGVLLVLLVLIRLCLLRRQRRRGVISRRPVRLVRGTRGALQVLVRTILG